MAFPRFPQPRQTHLVVLGGGYVGLEMCHTLQRFGSRVSVVEKGRPDEAQFPEDPFFAYQARLEDVALLLLLRG